MFVETIVGDGVAIRPSGRGNVDVLAPFDGTLVGIAALNHYCAIASEDRGVELLVHIGLDTEDLKGWGFRRVAGEGQVVKRGDVVLEVDLELLRERASRGLSPVVVSNVDEIVALVAKATGEVRAGESVLMDVKDLGI